MCPHCGKINNKDAKFCISCTNPLVNDLNIVCPFCGVKNSVEAKYCQESE
ncbi:MAG: zinc-ribbon domain-containing protein [Methanobacterium sp.]